jgi:hypothetical protein
MVLFVGNNERDSRYHEILECGKQIICYTRLGLNYVRKYLLLNVILLLDGSIYEQLCSAFMSLSY